MKKTFFSLLLVCGVSLPAHAQVAIEDPWVRGTVPQQQATGAFMVLTAKTDARLVAARSPVAGLVELHEMAMENDVMKMRAIPGLSLPAGQAVALKPGGYHIMLMALKETLTADTSVPLTLVFETPQGERFEQAITAPVAPLGAARMEKSGSHSQR
jgi:periplasmic copper chaperone A